MVGDHCASDLNVELALCRLCIKLHSCTPDQLDPGLRLSLQAWLSQMGLDLLQVGTGQDR